MKIRIRRGVGNYGHHEGGIIRPKNYASGAFEVPDNIGRNLIARGLADLDGDQPANIATPEQGKFDPTPAKKAAVRPSLKGEQAKELDEMTISELRAEAKARGVKVNASQSKAQLLAALRAPEDSSEVAPAPSFNPAASIT